MSRHLPVHPDEARPRLADHPRASAAIARAKAWGGLGGLVLALLASLNTGASLQTALVRGLGGGLAAYLAAWAVAVVVWTQIARSELDAHHARLAARHADALPQGAEDRGWRG